MRDRREPRAIDPDLLEPVPEWGRAAIAAVLDAPWACLPIADVPGGDDVADRLRDCDWLHDWNNLEGGRRVTLTPWATWALGYQLGERQRLRYDEERHEESVREYRRTVDRDGAVAIDVVEATKTTRVRVTSVEEPYRWYGPGEDLPRPRAPKSAGFVPLPFAERVAAPLESDVGASLTTMPAIQRLLLMGRIAAPLRPRARSKKTRTKSRGPKRA